MTTLADFLQHNVDGYLLHDLKKMGEPSMKIGYPLVMTTFAGMELLGALLSTKPFDKDDGRIYFKDYWVNYLYKSQTARQAYGPSLYKQMRHGIAHAFLLKGQLGVTTSLPAKHLSVEGGLFLVDAVQLSLDFIKSYEDVVKPLVAMNAGAVNGNTMQLRFDEIESANLADAKSSAFGTLTNPIATISAVTSSAPPATPVKPPSGNAPAGGSQGGPSGPIR